MSRVSLKATSLTSVPECWIMFNDFLVKPVSEDEVLDFPEWKLPAVIMYEREDGGDLRMEQMPTDLDSSVLLKDVSLAW